MMRERRARRQTAEAANGPARSTSNGQTSRAAWCLTASAVQSEPAQEEQNDNPEDELQRCSSQTQQAQTQSQRSERLNEKANECARRAVAAPPTVHGCCELQHTPQ